MFDLSFSRIQNNFYNNNQVGVKNRLIDLIKEIVKRLPWNI